MKKVKKVTFELPNLWIVAESNHQVTDYSDHISQRDLRRKKRR